MATKIYTSNFAEHGIYVNVDGKEVPVSFTGGRTQSKSGGEFRTDDEKIQEALEKHPMFNVRFKFTGAIMPKKAETPSNAPASASGETSEPNDSTATVVEEVTNFQAAKSWLMKNKGVESNDLPNAAAVRARAAELSVEFPSW